MNKVTVTMLMMLTCVFAWGSVFPIAKIILGDMSGLSLSIWRFTIAVVSLALFMRLSGKHFPSLSIRQYIVLTAVGVLGVGGFNLALFSGLQRTSATNGALIVALSPIMTSLLAAALSRKWLETKQVFSLIVALSGVVLVITNGSMERLIHLKLNQGDMIIALGMLTWSGYTVASQQLIRWLPPLEYSLFTMAAGGICLFLVSLFQSDIHPWKELMSLSWPLVASVFYIGLFATVIGYLCWNNGVKALGSAKASLYFNLVPVFAALVSVTLGQSITGIQVFGMLIVLTGLTLPFFVTWSSRSVSTADQVVNSRH